MAGMYVIVWRYAVPAGRTTAFVRAYGPHGDWTQLFATASAYEGTDLILGDDAGTYITIDRWRSKADFDGFLRESSDDYDELDSRLASLTADETLVGRGYVIAPHQPPPMP
jgi:hypothetical protein